MVMYLKCKSGSKRIGTSGTSGTYIFEPVYGWYEVTEHTLLNNTFSIGKCERNIYVLYHTETLQAVCIGTKGDMRKLATKMKVYTFDGINTWKNGSNTIRSLTKLQETKE